MISTTEDAVKNLKAAQDYYRHMLEKNFDAMEECLHPQIDFTSPFVELSGRKAVLEAAKALANELISIEIRSKFSANDEIMFAYDFMFPEPVGKLKSAVLMGFSNGLISRIELFFDTQAFRNES